MAKSDYADLPADALKDIEDREGRTVAAVIPLRYDSRFEMRPVRDARGKIMQDAEGNPRVESQEVHWVKWGKRGDPKHGGEDRISTVRKDRELWPALKPGYEAWLRGQDAPVNGTPLEAWPAMTSAEQIYALKARNIRSVEDMALATDADLDGIGMHARKLREAAQYYVKAKDQAGAAESMRQQKAEVDNLSLRNSELEEQMKAMQEQLRALTAAKATPPAPKQRAA